MIKNINRLVVGIFALWAFQGVNAFAQVDQGLIESRSWAEATEIIWKGEQGVSDFFLRIVPEWNIEADWETHPEFEPVNMADPQISIRGVIGGCIIELFSLSPDETKEICKAFFALSIGEEIVNTLTRTTTFKYVLSVSDSQVEVLTAANTVLAPDPSTTQSQVLWVVEARR